MRLNGRFDVDPCLVIRKAKSTHNLKKEISTTSLKNNDERFCISKYFSKTFKG